MTTFKLQGFSVAKRYGGVLFDLAAHDKTEKEILKDVTKLQSALREAAFEWSHVTNPTVSLHTQQGIVDKLAGVLNLSEAFYHFLKVVCQNRRLQALLSILEDFSERCKAATGKREGTVQTATRLTQKELKILESSLKKRLGYDVALQQIVRKNLLGGIVMRVGSMMIDASAKTQLRHFQNVMKG